MSTFRFRVRELHVEAQELYRTEHPFATNTFYLVGKSLAAAFPHRGAPKSKREVEVRLRSQHAPWAGRTPDFKATTQAELFPTPVVVSKSSNVDDDIWLRHLEPDDVVVTRDIAIGKGPFQFKTVRIYKVGLFAIAVNEKAGQAGVRPAPRGK